MLRNAPGSALALVCAVLIALSPAPDRHVNVAIAQGTDLDPDVYEPDDTPEQAHPLLPTTIPQPRNFHDATDVDWVYIDLDAGERVNIYTTGSCDTFITLFAPDARTPLAQDDDSGGDGNASLRFAAPIDATYFVLVRQFGRPQGGCGPYQLAAAFLPPPLPDALEPDNTPAQANPLPTDGSQQPHSIHVAGDQDWVSLAVQANTAFRIATLGDCDTVLTLFGPDGRTQLAEDDDSGPNGNSIVTYTFMQAGTYFARVRAFDEQVDVCDAYTISATSVPPSFPDAFEPDDTPEQARPLPLDGTPQQRSFHSGNDLDWVSVFLSTGDRILIWTTGPCDTYLLMVAPDGRTLVAEDDDSGEDQNAALFFAAKQGGQYYAVVRPFGGSSPTCPSYTLQGLKLPPAGPATPPGPTTVQAGDATPTLTPRPAIVPGASPTPTRLPPTATPVPTRTTR